jgi:hypothetical protein
MIPAANNHHPRFLSLAKGLFFYFALMMFATESQAHPVSYQDSLMLESFNMHNMNENNAFYSPKHWWSFGIQNFRLQDGVQNQYSLYPRVAFLKRWNQTNSQANLYVWGGAGWSRFGDNDGFSTMAGTQFDAESRRLYFNSQVQTLQHKDIQDVWMVRTSAGAAPYLANSGELQGFIIVQAFYNSIATESWSIGPMVRLYYKSVLVELGSSLRGEWMLNFMSSF